MSEPNAQPPVDILWRFSSDGAGGGAWSQESISFESSPSPPRLVRPVYGCSTTIGDVGYYIGGKVTYLSDPNTLPGYGFSKHDYLIQFLFWYLEWENSCRHRQLRYKRGIKSCEHSCVGSRRTGLMFILGGRDPGTNATQPPANYIAFSNITIYDPYVDRWYAQQAERDIPDSREQFCAVSMPGDNGTYEMLVDFQLPVLFLNF